MTARALTGLLLAAVAASAQESGRSSGPADPVLHEARRLTDADPLSPEGWFRAARALEAGGRLARAAQFCEYALERPAGPERLEIALRHHDILVRLGRHAEATAAARGIVFLEPGNAVHHARLGAAHVREGRDGEAVDPLTRALRSDPRAPEPRAMRAGAFRRLGRLAEAAEDLRILRTLSTPGTPRHHDATRDAIDTACRLGDFGAARGLLQDLALCDPAGARDLTDAALLLQGRCLTLSGRIFDSPDAPLVTHLRAAAGGLAAGQQRGVLELIDAVLDEAPLAPEAWMMRLAAEPDARGAIVSALGEALAEPDDADLRAALLPGGAAESPDVVAGDPFYEISTRVVPPDRTEARGGGEASGVETSRARCGLLHAYWQGALAAEVFAARCERREFEEGRPGRMAELMVGLTLDAGANRDAALALLRAGAARVPARSPLLALARRRLDEPAPAEPRAETGPAPESSAVADLVALSRDRAAPEALRLLRRAAALHPSDPQPWFEAGVVAAERLDTERAAQFHGEAARRAPGDGEIASHHLRTLAAEGCPAEFLRHADPSPDPSLLVDAMRAHVLAGDSGRAAALARRAMGTLGLRTAAEETGPFRTWILLDVAEAALAGGDRDLALEALDLADEPSEAVALRRAAVFAGLDDLDRALRVLEEAAEAAGDSSLLLHERRGILVMQGDAEALLRSVEGAGEDDADAPTFRALADILAGRSGEAGGRLLPLLEQDGWIADALLAVRTAADAPARRDVARVLRNLLAEDAFGGAAPPDPRPGFEDAFLDLLPRRPLPPPSTRVPEAWPAGAPGDDQRARALAAFLSDEIGGGDFVRAFAELPAELFRNTRWAGLLHPTAEAEAHLALAFSRLAEGRAALARPHLERAVAGLGFGSLLHAIAWRELRQSR